MTQTKIPEPKPDSKGRVIIGISGASGAILAIRMLEILQPMPYETHLVISPAAHATIVQETDWKVSAVLGLADVTYSYQDIGAKIASGSFPTLGMIVVPCSVKTLSAIANGYTDNLLARAADVTLKEGRTLILAFRETPLHRGHLRLMSLAAEAGAIIFPPVPAYYARPQTVDELVTNLAGRILTRFGIENAAYFKWKDEAENE